MMKKFQILIILFAYFIYISNGQKKKLTGAQRKACVAKSGVNPSSEEEFKRLVNEGDKKIGCFIVCAMKASGGMSKDGVINQEEYKKDISAKFESYKVCLEDHVNAQKNGADECQIIILLAHCMRLSELVPFENLRTLEFSGFIQINSD